MVALLFTRYFIPTCILPSSVRTNFRFNPFNRFVRFVCVWRLLRRAWGGHTRVGDLWFLISGVLPLLPCIQLYNVVLKLFLLNLEHHQFLSLSFNLKHTSLYNIFAVATRPPLAIRVRIVKVLPLQRMYRKLISCKMHIDYPSTWSSTSSL